MENINKFSAVFAELTLKLLRENNKAENIIISPVSLLSALNLCMNGADGKTKEQIISLFGGLCEEEINEYMGSLRQILDEEGVGINLANGIFTDRNNITLKEEYISLIKEKFDAIVIGEDFSDDSAADRINLWVKDNTEGLIEKITDSVKDLCMIIINALSFDGEWVNPFMSEKNTEGIFYGKENIAATFMNSAENCYIEFDNAKGFVKNYFGGYSFAGILPDEGVEIDEIISSLDGEALLRGINYDNFDSADISIPKFNVKSELKLKESLMNIGIKDMFDKDNGDFSGMCVEKVCADDVIHSCAVLFTEAGTKAAAVTAVGIMRMSLPVITHTLIFDRPFLWIILKDEGKIPVFMGLVKDIN